MEFEALTQRFWTFPYAHSHSLSLSLYLCLSVFTLANVRFHKMWYLSLYPYLSFVPSNSLHLALCGALSLSFYLVEKEKDIIW